MEKYKDKIICKNRDTGNKKGNPKLKFMYENSQANELKCKNSVKASVNFENFKEDMGQFIELFIDKKVGGQSRTKRKSKRSSRQTRKKTTRKTRKPRRTIKKSIKKKRKTVKKTYRKR